MSNHWDFPSTDCSLIVAKVLEEDFQDPMRDLPCQLTREQVQQFEDAGIVKFAGSCLEAGPVWGVIGHPAYAYMGGDTDIRLVYSPGQDNKSE